MTVSTGARRSESDRAAPLDQIVQLWNRGLTQAQIGRVLGATASTICGCISRARERGDLRFKPRAPGSPRRVKKPKPAGTDVEDNRRAEAHATREGSVTAKSALEAVTEPQAPDSRPGGPTDAIESVVKLMDVHQIDMPGFPLVDLAANSCRYPVSQEGSMLFRGAPVTSLGKSWCARHAAIVRSGAGVSGAALRVAGQRR